MGKLSRLILQKLHILIILYTAYTTYDAFDKHQSKMEQLNERLPVLNNKIRKVTRDIERAREYQENFEIKKKEVEEIQKQIETAQRQLPNSTDDTGYTSRYLRIFHKINRGNKCCFNNWNGNRKQKDQASDQYTFILP